MKYSEWLIIIKVETVQNGDTDSTLDEARTNTNDSTIKVYIDYKLFK